MKKIKHSASQLLSFSATKAIALVVVACFFISSVCRDAIAAAVTSTMNAQEFKQIFNDFMLPYSYGKISGSYFAGTDRVVINIQDLHCHPQVQKSISNIIEMFDNKYGVSTIYLEGAYGNVSAKPFLQNLINPTQKNEILDKLLESGRLTGAEYYSATSNKTDIIKGLEKKGPYLENLKRFGNLLEVQDQIAIILKGVEESTKKVKKQYYTRRQYKIEKLSKDYLEGKIKAEKYYRLLAKHTEKLGIDLTKYENTFLYMQLLALQSNLNYKAITTQLQTLVLLLKENLPPNAYQILLDNTKNFEETDKLYAYIIKLSKSFGLDLDVNFKELNKYFTFIELSQKINPLELLKEEENLTREINTRFSDTVAQREVVFLTNFEKYLKDYLSTKITSDDYEYYKENIETYKKLWNKYVDNKVLSLLEPYMQETDKFYKINTDRNNYFTENIFKGIETSKIENIKEEPNEVSKIIENMDKVKRVDVIITGGFHSQTVSEILKQHGISYIVITPNVQDGVKEAEKTYYQIAKQQKEINFQTLAARIIFEIYGDKNLSEVVRAKILKDSNLNEQQIKAIIGNRSMDKSVEDMFGLSDEDFIEKYGSNEDESVMEDLFNLSKEDFIKKYNSKMYEEEGKKSYERNKSFVDAIVDTTEKQEQRTESRLKGLLGADNWKKISPSAKDKLKALEASGGVDDQLLEFIKEGIANSNVRETGIVIGYDTQKKDFYYITKRKLSYFDKLNNTDPEEKNYYSTFRDEQNKNDNRTKTKLKELVGGEENWNRMSRLAQNRLITFYKNGEIKEEYIKNFFGKVFSDVNDGKVAPIDDYTGNFVGYDDDKGDFFYVTERKKSFLRSNVEERNYSDFRNKQNKTEIDKTAAEERLKKEIVGEDNWSKLSSDAQNRLIELEMEEELDEAYMKNNFFKGAFQGISEGKVKPIDNYSGVVIGYDKDKDDFYYVIEIRKEASWLYRRLNSEEFKETRYSNFHGKQNKDNIVADNIKSRIGEDKWNKISSGAQRRLIQLHKKGELDEQYIRFIDEAINNGSKDNGVSFVYYDSSKQDFYYEDSNGQRVYQTYNVNDFFETISKDNESANINYNEYFKKKLEKGEMRILEDSNAEGKIKFLLKVKDDKGKTKWERWESSDAGFRKTGEQTELLDFNLDTYLNTGERSLRELTQIAENLESDDIDIDQLKQLVSIVAEFYGISDEERLVDLIEKALDAINKGEQKSNLVNIFTDIFISSNQQVEIISVVKNIFENSTPEIIKLFLDGDENTVFKYDKENGLYKIEGDKRIYLKSYKIEKDDGYLEEISQEVEDNAEPVVEKSYEKLEKEIASFKGFPNLRRSDVNNTFNELNRIMYEISKSALLNDRQRKILSEKLEEKFVDLIATNKDLDNLGKTNSLEGTKWQSNVVTIDIFVNNILGSKLSDETKLKIFSLKGINVDKLSNNTKKEVEELTLQYVENEIEKLNIPDNLKEQLKIYTRKAYKSYKEGNELKAFNEFLNIFENSDDLVDFVYREMFNEEAKNKGKLIGGKFLQNDDNIDYYIDYETGTKVLFSEFKYAVGIIEVSSFFLFKKDVENNATEVNINGKKERLLYDSDREDYYYVQKDNKNYVYFEEFRENLQLSFEDRINLLENIEEAEKLKQEIENSELGIKDKTKLISILLEYEKELQKRLEYRKLIEKYVLELEEIKEDIAKKEEQIKQSKDKDEIEKLKKELKDLKNAASDLKKKINETIEDSPLNKIILKKEFEKRDIKTDIQYLEINSDTVNIVDACIRRVNNSSLLSDEDKRELLDQLIGKIRNSNLTAGEKTRLANRAEGTAESDTYLQTQTEKYFEKEIDNLDLENGNKITLLRKNILSSSTGLTETQKGILLSKLDNRIREDKNKKLRLRRKVNNFKPTGIITKNVNLGDIENNNELNTDDKENINEIIKEIDTLYPNKNSANRKKLLKSLEKNVNKQIEENKSNLLTTPSYPAQIAATISLLAPIIMKLKEKTEIKIKKEEDKQKQKDRLTISTKVVLLKIIKFLLDPVYNIVFAPVWEEALFGKLVSFGIMLFVATNPFGWMTGYAALGLFATARVLFALLHYWYTDFSEDKETKKKNLKVRLIGTFFTSIPYAIVLFGGMPMVAPLITGLAGSIPFLPLAVGLLGTLPPLAVATIVAIGIHIIFNFLSQKFGFASLSFIKTIKIMEKIGPERLMELMQSEKGEIKTSVNILEIYEDNQKNCLYDYIKFKIEGNGDINELKEQLEKIEEQQGKDLLMDVIVDIHNDVVRYVDIKEYYKDKVVENNIYDLFKNINEKIEKGYINEDILKYLTITDVIELEKTKEEKEFFNKLKKCFEGELKEDISISNYSSKNYKGEYKGIKFDMMNPNLIKAIESRKEVINKELEYAKQFGSYYDKLVENGIKEEDKDLLDFAFYMKVINLAKGKDEDSNYENFDELKKIIEDDTLNIKYRLFALTYFGIEKDIDELQEGTIQQLKDDFVDAIKKGEITIGYNKDIGLGNDFDLRAVSAGIFLIEEEMLSQYFYEGTEEKTKEKRKKFFLQLSKSMFINTAEDDIFIAFSSLVYGSYEKYIDEKGNMDINRFISTIAHELGHVFHDYFFENNGYNNDFLSRFCQELIADTCSEMMCQKLEINADFVTDCLYKVFNTDKEYEKYFAQNEYRAGRGLIYLLEAFFVENGEQVDYALLVKTVADVLKFYYEAPLNENEKKEWFRKNIIYDIEVDDDFFDRFDLNISNQNTMIKNILELYFLNLKNNSEISLDKIEKIEKEIIERDSWKAKIPDLFRELKNYNEDLYGKIIEEIVSQWGDYEISSYGVVAHEKLNSEDKNYRKQVIVNMVLSRPNKLFKGEKTKNGYRDSIANIILKTILTEQNILTEKEIADLVEDENLTDEEKYERLYENIQKMNDQNLEDILVLIRAIKYGYDTTIKDIKENPKPPVFVSAEDAIAEVLKSVLNPMKLVNKVSKYFIENEIIKLLDNKKIALVKKGVATIETGVENARYYSISENSNGLRNLPHIKIGEIEGVEIRLAINADNEFIFYSNTTNINNIDGIDAKIEELMDKFTKDGIKTNLISENTIIAFAYNNNGKITIEDISRSIRAKQTDYVMHGISSIHSFGNEEITLNKCKNISEFYGITTFSVNKQIYKQIYNNNFSEIEKIKNQGYNVIVEETNVNELIINENQTECILDFSEIECDLAKLKSIREQILEQYGINLTIHMKLSKGNLKKLGNVNIFEETGIIPMIDASFLSEINVNGKIGVYNITSESQIKNQTDIVCLMFDKVSEEKLNKELSKKGVFNGVRNIIEQITNIDSPKNKFEDGKNKALSSEKYKLNISDDKKIGDIIRELKDLLEINIDEGVAEDKIKEKFEQLAIDLFNKDAAEYIQTRYISKDNYIGALGFILGVVENSIVDEMMSEMLDNISDDVKEKIRKDMKINEMQGILTFTIYLMLQDKFENKNVIEMLFKPKDIDVNMSAQELYESKKAELLELNKALDLFLRKGFSVTEKEIKEGTKKNLSDIIEDVNNIIPVIWEDRYGSSTGVVEASAIAMDAFRSMLAAA